MDFSKSRIDVEPGADATGPVPVRTRNLVRDCFGLDFAIDDFRTALDLAERPERWSPFVVASITGSTAVAVVVPTRLGGVWRLRGEVAQPSHRGDFSLAAVGGFRHRGLCLVHEITAIRTGSFHTSLAMTTTIRGLRASLVSSRRIADWHAAEFAKLRSRVSRSFARSSV
jgi:hypothetical protein